jgi:lipopolysaccharide transport system permease protein
VARIPCGHDGLATTVLLFLSPVLYPVAAVPPAFRQWMLLNPLTSVIEQARSVAIRGELPNPWMLAATLLAGLATAVLGLMWFRKTRRGFADVL